MVNSKAKGSSFERGVCKRLSLWISHDKQEDALWRSSQSGGRSTTAFKKGKRFSDQAGDICSIHPIGRPLTDRFLIECKHIKTLKFSGLITNKGNLVEFWAKAKEQATQHKKMPMLIAKQNSQPVIVCLTKEGAEALAIKLKCILTVPRMNFYVFLFEDIIKWATRPGIIDVDSTERFAPK